MRMNWGVLEMNIALLTAAGTASRMRQSIPKQFLHIDNKPIIIYTMEVFQNDPNIDALMVVTLEGWREVLLSYANQHGITKLKWVVAGGSTGQESIYKGLKELEYSCEAQDTVMVHDGNRPLITNEIISDSLATFKDYGGAVAAIPCNEAVFRSEDGLSSDFYIPREQLFRTQTPHTYSLGKLLWAHEEAAKKGIENSVASCTLMQELGEKIYLSKGSEKNIKLTTMEDMEILKALLHTQ